MEINQAFCHLDRKFILENEIISLVTNGPYSTEEDCLLSLTQNLQNIIVNIVNLISVFVFRACAN